MNRLVIIATAVAVASCYAELPGTQYFDQPIPNATVKDGYLRFENSAALEDCLEQLDAPRTRASFGVAGFTSINDRKVSCNEASLDATALAVQKAEALLTEPTLRQVLDTALVIEVGDRIYKITENGTFSFPLGTGAAKISQVTDSFDASLIRTVEKGSSVDLAGGVYWINTYGPENEDETYPELVELQDEPETRAVTTNLSNNLHSGYNVKTYTWKGNALTQKFLELILIKDYTERIDLDSTHRLCVQLYNNNWGFVEVAGIKTYLQKKVKILFVNTWWETDDASCRIAMGINYMYSEHKNYMTPTKYMAFTPTSFTNFSRYTASVTGYGNGTFLYGTVSDVPYFSNWTTSKTLIMPYLNMNGDTITEDTKKFLDALYDEQPSKLMSTLNATASKLGQPKRPAVFFIPESGTNTFRNDLTLAAGLAEYPKTSTQRLKFLSKGGFSWSGGIPAPIQFSKYDITAIDCFGAIYYNGKWKGVRYTFN